MIDIFTQNDFWTNLKERLTNPFLLSFAISWLIWNWPITIGLIWYSADNINLFGYSSYDSLIKCNTNWIWNFFLPILTALFYTFVFPYFKKIVNSFNAKIDKEDQDKILEIAGTGNIPTITFLELQKTYDERIKSLSGLIKTQSVTKSENISLSTTIDEKNKLIEELKQSIGLFDTDRKNELMELTSNADISHLEGKWFAITVIHEFSSLKNSVWEFEFGTLNIEYDNYRVEFKIIGYTCNPLTKDTILIIRPKDNSNLIPIIFTNLYWNKDFTELKSKAVANPTLNTLNLTKAE